jgi:hypothetical protein
MTRRQAQMWSWSAIGFVIVAAIVGALVERATHRLAAGVESRFGYVPNPEGTREFLRELQHPLFADAAPAVMENAKGRDVFLYRHADKAHRAVYGKPFEVWDQGPHGSCVSFGFALASYVGQSVDWTQGERADPPKLVATESIYGGSRTLARLPPQARNTGGDGSYGGAAARWISGRCKDPTVGGILYREKYGDIDLTTYSIPRSENWGREGVPASLAREGMKHAAQGVALCRDWASLCASLENGMPVAICSGVGFGPKWGALRDADGFLSRPRGSQWRHCMMILGVRHKANGSPRDGALIANSWSTAWISGRVWPEDMPAGCFWADRDAVQEILDAEDSFSLAGVNGFAARDIDNGNWFEPAPAADSQKMQVFAKAPQPARLIADVYSLAP